MMPRQSVSRFHNSRVAYAGERDWLAWEMGELRHRLETLPLGSRLRPGIEFVLARITRRMLEIEAIGPEIIPPGSTRKDLQ